MVNTKFEIYKLKREILKSGVEFSFKRVVKNQFKERFGDVVYVGNTFGLYHEQNSNIEIVTSEATQIRTKKIPMILCLWESVTGLGLQMNDVVDFNGKTYKITGVVNIQEWNLIADISLEVVDNGFIG